MWRIRTSTSHFGMCDIRTANFEILIGAKSLQISNCRPVKNSNVFVTHMNNSHVWIIRANSSHVWQIRSNLKVERICHTCENSNVFVTPVKNSCEFFKSIVFYFSFDKVCRLPRNYTNVTQWIVNGISPLFKFKGCSALSNEKMGYMWEEFLQSSTIISGCWQVKIKHIYKWIIY